MAITTALCNSFKTEILTATHNFTASTGNTFKFLLIKSSMTGTYNKSTTNAGTPGSGTPSSSNVGTDAQASTGDYNSVNGVSLTNITPALSTDTACCDFSDLSLTGTTISADGCMIYNSSASNKTVAVYDFGGTKTTSSGTFGVTFPTADASNAIIRIA